MSMVTLGSKAPGDIVTLNESGAPVEFYVAAQDYESELNGAGRTLLVRKDVCTYGGGAWNTSGVNTYANSSIDSYLNESYKAMLDPDVQSRLGQTSFRCAIGGGNNTVTTLSRNVFLLSASEMGYVSDGALTVLDEGQSIPIASSLRVAYMDGAAWTYWIRSCVNTNASSARAITSAGALGNSNVKGGWPYRPAFTLPGATTFVDDSGAIVFNQPPPTPVITPPAGCVWGVMTGATCTAVQDPEGETVTYEWGMSVDNEVWMPLQASGTTCDYTPFADHYLRVRAVDTAENASGYDTTALITVQRWGGQIIYGGGA